MCFELFSRHIVVSKLNISPFGFKKPSGFSFLGPALSIFCTASEFMRRFY